MSVVIFQLSFAGYCWVRVAQVSHKVAGLPAPTSQGQVGGGGYSGACLY